MHPRLHYSRKAAANKMRTTAAVAYEEAFKESIKEIRKVSEKEKGKKEARMTRGCVRLCFGAAPEVYFGLPEMVSWKNGAEANNFSCRVDSCACNLHEKTRSCRNLFHSVPRAKLFQAFHYFAFPKSINFSSWIIHDRILRNPLW